MSSMHVDFVPESPCLVLSTARVANHAAGGNCRYRKGRAFREGRERVWPELRHYLAPPSGFTSLIDVATSRGGVNDQYTDTGRIGAVLPDGPLGPMVAERLTRGAREALAQLRDNAVPRGCDLLDGDGLVVLAPGGRP